MTELSETDLQEHGRRLIHNEVHAVISALVSTLAEGYGADPRGRGSDLNELTEQAYELARPIEDWKEAAEQAGWEIKEQADGDNAFVNTEDGGRVINSIDTDEDDAWERLCHEEDIEPYQWDVYEHWIISEWLADKLEAKGERIDRDFAGLTVWGRTTTGQAIYMDHVIREIVRELHAKVEGA